MVTPTAPRVMAREETPAEYRPGNQARLVPGQATNYANTNDMLPGMGIVQSGNGYNDNGLAPVDARNFRRAASHMQNKMQQVQKAGTPNMAPNAQVETVEQALTTGRQKPYWKQDIVIQDARKLNRGQSVNITPAPDAPMTPGMARLMHGARPEVLTGAGRNKGRGDSMWSGTPQSHLKQIYAPASPLPDADVPGGISHQANRGQIMAMQKGISPVNGLGEVLRGPAIGSPEWTAVVEKLKSERGSTWMVWFNDLLNAKKIVLVPFDERNMPGLGFPKKGSPEFNSLIGTSTAMEASVLQDLLNDNIIRLTTFAQQNPAVAVPGGGGFFQNLSTTGWLAVGAGAIGIYMFALRPMMKKRK